jgi:Na+/H+-dicarboxylate symporter
MAHQLQKYVTRAVKELRDTMVSSSSMMAAYHKTWDVFENFLKDYIYFNLPIASQINMHSTVIYAYDISVFPQKYDQKICCTLI